MLHRSGFYRLWTELVVLWATALDISQRGKALQLAGLPVWSENRRKVTFGYSRVGIDTTAMSQSASLRRFSQPTGRASTVHRER